MENEDLIRDQMEDTRTALTEKLETLEKKVTDSVESASANVAQTVEAVTGSVQETVSNVKETVAETISAVKDSVHGSVEAVKDVFNLNGQIERHPWAAFGCSLVVGYVVGRSVAGMTGPKVSDDAKASRPTHRNGRSGLTEAPAMEAEEKPRSHWLSALTPEIDQLKGLAIGAVMDVVREMITEAAPSNLKDDLARIINGVGAKLGGKPLERPGEEPAEPSWERSQRWSGVR
jgi:ElaB/YqjD/DUF883 family membrane-anchored ribosome-binding protein